MSSPRRSILFATVPLFLPALCAAQLVERVSVDAQGAQAANESHAPVLALDQPLVTFSSRAANLVAGDTNGVEDVFLKNYATGAVDLISVGSGNTPANGASAAPCISANEQFIAFESDASNLVFGDTNGRRDVFVSNVIMGGIELVSVGIVGQGNNYSIEPSINQDGSIVAFTSKATNLVAGDTNAALDVFVRYLSTSTTVRVTAGVNQANGNSGHPRLSRWGTTLAFESDATNFVAGDLNAASDVFVAELATGQVVAASYGPTGTANGASRAPSMSPSGVIVAFEQRRNEKISGSDVNGFTDVYAYNASSAQTVRVSLRTDWGETNGRSYAPSVSYSGVHIAYCSEADNLAPGDTNGATDVFFCFLDNPGTTRIVSRGESVLCGNAASRAPSLDQYGDHVAFETGASNLVTGDTNGVSDIYLRRQLVTPVANYCTAGITTHGCTAQISTTGIASVSSASPPFTITATSVEGQRSGLIFYGLAPTGHPWGTGGTSYLCLASPTQRSTAANSGGTSGSCDGVLAMDFNAWMAAQPSSLGAPYTAGEWVYAQAWFRDPGAAKNTSLSNAVKFQLGW